MHLILCNFAPLIEKDTTNIVIYSHNTIINNECNS